MSRWITYGLVLGLAGCVPPFEPGSSASIADQEVAVRTIWRDGFGRADNPPRVRWIFPDQQDCVHPRSGRGGFETLFGCVEGLTISPFVVTVAWSEGDTFSGTTLAHELVHAAQARRLVFDAGHQSAEFQPGGAVDQVNGLLVDAGL